MREFHVAILVGCLATLASDIFIKLKQCNVCHVWFVWIVLEILALQWKPHHTSNTLPQEHCELSQYLTKLNYELTVNVNVSPSQDSLNLCRLLGDTHR
jgi:hypothetical protein